MDKPKNAVFDLEALIRRRAAPLIERTMIVDPDPAASRALAELLRLIAPSQIWTATDPTSALGLAGRIDPRTVFVEQAGGMDGEAFVRAFRRAPATGRKAVVIMLTRRPTLSGIIAARDCGAHEVLRKPITQGELVRRLAAAASEERAWIEVETYVGPDRRRFNAGDYAGVLRRKSDRSIAGAA
ncbi:MAG: response regulator [Caulobacteraceae bacterium]